MSTVGTGSEVYHYLRLLFAAQGIAHGLRCGVPGEAAEPAQLAGRITRDFACASFTLLAPLIRQRKGIHREAIAIAAKRGIERVRIDGAVHDAATPPRLDRYRVHDVDAVVAEYGDGRR